ncbi:hypothetical protein GCM10007939_12260 [Amylibacter marinus]|uniref:Uncharacterized protein n=1 Tax=Amylibacter marinus TaxID=1475483 RepID=A0ABQ5VU30_9RHOB|nr:hypothetical protein [Amylibacter marinus]GLQ34943.1 hypothetical protein GCM10007939_12260 [Amylibacter marinus]
MSSNQGIGREHLSMDIRIYLGPYRTASQHIYDILEKNADVFSDQNIVIVPPEAHRDALESALKALGDGLPKADAGAQFIREATQGSAAKRIVLLDHQIGGSVLRPVSRSLLFPPCGAAVARYSTLLPLNSYRFFMATRNLTTLLPSCYGSALGHAKIEEFSTFVENIEIPKVKWSDLLNRVTRRQREERGPRHHVVTWKYEDYPRIWRDVIQAITGIENAQDLHGDSRPVNQGLSLYGCQLMYQYLLKHKPAQAGDFEKIKRAFVLKFPNTDAPRRDDFWTAEVQDQMTFAYEDDWYYIERMDNVATIQPRPNFLD